MSEERGAGQDKSVLIFKAEPGFEWRGVRPDIKPSMLPPDVPQQMVNMRLRAGEPEGRGGQKLICSHSHAITGIFDFFTEVTGGTGPVRNPRNTVLFSGSFGGPGASAMGYMAANVSGAEQSVMCPSWTDSDGQSDYPFAVLGGVVYHIHREDSVYTLCTTNLSQSSYSSAYLDHSDYLTRVVATIPGTAGRHCMISTGNVILISAHSAATGDTIVYTWDGTTLTEDHTITGKCITAIGRTSNATLFLDALVASVDPHDVIVRSDAGVWSVMSMDPDVLYGPPSDQYYPGNVSVVFQGEGFFLSENERAIYSTDGETAVRYGQDLVATEVDASVRIHSLATDGTNLYYLWTNSPIAGEGFLAFYVGKFDGTTWTPEYKDLSMDFPSYNVDLVVVDSNTESRFQLDHDGTNLIASVFGGASDAIVPYIVSSVDGDLAGTWSERLAFDPAVFNTPASTIITNMKAVLL